MHPYSLDDDERPGLYGSMALVAVGLTYATHYVVDLTKVVLPLLVDPPSFAVWFGLIVYLFDRWIWRCSIFGLRLSKIPVFDGVYRGRLTAIFGGHIQPIELKMTIKQRWSQLEILGETDFTKAVSTMASVSGRDGELRYEYLNVPRLAYKNTRPQTRGASGLKLIAPDNIAGDYYTKSSSGDVELERREASAEDVQD